LIESLGMSITIRLAKEGKRNAPSYKVVVAQTRSKRNGKPLDVLGYFNPSKNPKEFSISEEKYTEWTKKGALVTPAIKNLIAGTYEFVKYSPKKDK